MAHSQIVSVITLTRNESDRTYETLIAPDQIHQFPFRVPQSTKGGLTAKT